MNAHPDQELLQAIAAELGVDPSFVEKDWYAMRLVAVLADVRHGELRPVFSGGTSLSKGYGLIQRFSEDLDFKLTIPESGMDRDARRYYRSLVVAAIRAAGDWTLKDADIMAANESRFFKCQVGYPTSIPVVTALRPQIKLEMSISPPALPTEERSLQSFVAAARDDDPEVRAIACVAPAETAADKLSALVWRVLSRRRDAATDDPALIRHLHDLAALEAHASIHPDFPEQLYRNMAQDVERGQPTPDIATMPLQKRMAAALQVLTEDPAYQEEYERFVLAMSYASEGETFRYDDALAAARRLGTQLR